MTVDKLSRLFAALGSSTQSSTPTKENESTEKVPDEGAEGSSEAVNVSKDFGVGNSGGSDSARAAKVQQLKQQVADGSYNPDTRAVAQSVAQELFS